MDSRELPMYFVDVFTRKRFGGNPCAVALLPADLQSKEPFTDEEKQSIAVELKQTVAYVTEPENGDFKSGSSFALRWFTPSVEIDLCGHGTLAAAAVLFHEIGNASGSLEFSTKSGKLKVSRDGSKLDASFPSNPPSIMEQGDLKSLLQVSVGDLSLVQDVQLSKTGMFLVRLRDDVSRKTIEDMKPDLDRMVEAYNQPGIVGLGLTLKGSKGNGCVNDQGEVYDFVSRFFLPWLGLREDPVTGSWHTVATPYWAKELGKTELFARQCSQRGGELWLAVHGDRVTVRGETVLNLKGTFSL